MTLTKHYDKKNDIFAISWGDCEFSRDFFDGDLILDFDKNENVTGFEFLNIKHYCKESDEKTRKLLEGISIGKGSVESTKNKEIKG